MGCGILDGQKKDLYQGVGGVSFELSAISFQPSAIRSSWQKSGSISSVPCSL
jgi:hypothetical protein